MKEKIFLALFFLAVLLAAASGSIYAQEEDSLPKPVSGPALSLNIYGEKEFTADAKEPLLLAVGINNPEAFNLSALNENAKQVVDEARKGGDWDSMSKAERRDFQAMHSAHKIPVVTLGSQKRPVWNLISFVVKSASKDALIIRALSTNAGREKKIELNEYASASLYYGADAQALSSLPEGDYYIQARLDTKEEKGMWQGEALSPAVKVTLKKEFTPASQDEAYFRNYLYGRFYLYDEQWERVEEYALRLLGQDEESVEAWELRADAFVGKGELEDAEASLIYALNLFESKHRNDEPEENEPQEGPRYLERRLGEVQALQASQEQAKK